MKKIFSLIRSYWFLLRFYLYCIFVLATPLPYYKYLTKKGRIDERNEKAFKAIKKWAKYSVKIGKSTVTVTGLENIPKDEPILFLSNHQSYADIPMLIYALNDFNIGFMLKKSITNIPFIKDYLKYMNCVPIDQKNIREAAKSVNKSVEFINEGKSLLIFPEGKRSFSNTPDEFKNGAFKIAQKTGVTVVPIYIHNVHLVYEGNERMIAPADVSINVLEPIRTAGLKRAEVQNLSDTVYNMIYSKSKSY